VVLAIFVLALHGLVCFGGGFLCDAQGREEMG
jgi:hypothetical protein